MATVADGAARRRRPVRPARGRGGRSGSPTGSWGVRGFEARREEVEAWLAAQGPAASSSEAPRVGRDRRPARRRCRAQIAAGEVVERPGVGGEGAGRERARRGRAPRRRRLAGGGIDGIAVRDDGERHDAPTTRCSPSPATPPASSTRLEDLDGVGTLGFRGEALPSIAARRRRAPRHARARRGRRRRGRRGRRARRARRPAPPARPRHHGRRCATSSRPCRRGGSSCARPATEVGHVVELLTRLAVGRAGRRLPARARRPRGARAIRRCATCGTRLARCSARSAHAALVPVAGGRAAASRLTGFLGRAERDARERAPHLDVRRASAARRRPVAGRWVRDRLLLRAVLDGYASLVMRGRYPVAVLFLGVPPGEVDVNVHPAKLEVRFRRPSAVHHARRARASAQRLAEALAPTSARRRAVREAPPAVPSFCRAGARTAPAAARPARRSRRRARSGRRRRAASARCASSASSSTAISSARATGGWCSSTSTPRTSASSSSACGPSARGRGVERDPLLVPETVDAAAGARAPLLAEHAGDARGGGPRGRAVRRRHVAPAHGAAARCAASDVGELLRDARGRAGRGRRERGGRARRRRRARHASPATASSASASGSTAAEVRALLGAMDGVEVRAHCPHGRPVAAELSAERSSRRSSGDEPPACIVCLVGPTASGKSALALDARRAPRRRDRVRRLAPGLSRPRHRHREADAPRSARACRTTCLDLVEPDETLRRRPLPGGRARRPSPTWPRARPRRCSWSAAPASTCASCCTGSARRRRAPRRCAPRSTARGGAGGRRCTARSRRIDPDGRRRASRPQRRGAHRARARGGPRDRHGRSRDWQAAHRFAEAPYDALVIGLARPDAGARPRASRRAREAMLAAGFLDEVRALARARPARRRARAAQRRLPRDARVPRRRARRGGRAGGDRARHAPVREAAADVVPARARGRLASSRARPRPHHRRGGGLPRRRRLAGRGLMPAHAYLDFEHPLARSTRRSPASPARRPARATASGSGGCGPSGAGSRRTSSRADAVGARAALAPPRPARDARLRRHAVPRVRRAARRPRASATTRRSSAASARFRGRAGGGRRPPARPRHRRERATATSACRTPRATEGDAPLPSSRSGSGVPILTLVDTRARIRASAPRSAGRPRRSPNHAHAGDRSACRS